MFSMEFMNPIVSITTIYRPQHAYADLSVRYQPITKNKYSDILLFPISPITSYHNPLPPSSGALPLLLLCKDKVHLAPNLGFHGFLVPLSAAS